MQKRPQWAIVAVVVVLHARALAKETPFMT